jgi:hypothetical protein
MQGASQSSFVQCGPVVSGMIIKVWNMDNDDRWKTLYDVTYKSWQGLWPGELERVLHKRAVMFLTLSKVSIFVF